MELVINRKRWMRGTDEGLLLSSTSRRMCCVGFYARKLGMKPCEISDIPGLEDTKRGRDVCTWVDHNDLGKLYNVNDESTITDREREAKIRKLFKKHGVRVKFIN